MGTQQVTLTIDKAAARYFQQAAKETGNGATPTSEMRKVLHKKAGIAGDGAVRNWTPEKVKKERVKAKAAKAKAAKAPKKKAAAKKKAKPVMPRPPRAAKSKRKKT